MFYNLLTSYIKSIARLAFIIFITASVAAAITVTPDPIITAPVTKTPVESRDTVPDIKVPAEYKMPAGTMENTIKTGDILSINKRISNPKRTDIVAYIGENPNFITIGRIIGMPGDTISILNKVLYLNNIKFKERYAVHKERNNLPASFNPRDNFGPIKLGSAEYFIMGDNRDRSYDCRFWRPVRRDEIVGEVVKISKK